MRTPIWALAVLSFSLGVSRADEPAKPASETTTSTVSEPAKPNPVAVESTPPADPKPAAPKEPAKPPVDDDPDVAARRATEYPLEDDEWKEYALGILEMEMQEAIEDLSNGKPKPPALVTQPRIISRLDVMIEELEKKTGSGKGSNNAGNKPAEKSVLRKGKMKDGEMRAVDTDGKRLDRLTPKEREKILQAQGEGFPAGYEDVLQDYFRKLAASEKTTPGTKPDLSPPSKE